MMKTIAGLVAGITLAAGLGTGSAAAQTTEWRFSHTYAPARAESGFIRKYSEDLKARSQGKFVLNVLEGGASGLRDADALRWMQTGTPEMGFVWPPFLGRDAPDLATLSVYGAIATREEFARVTPAMKEILSAGFAKWNIDALGYMGIGLNDGSLFCRQPVRTLAELRRLKLRVGTRDQIDTFKTLGVAAQIVPQNDLYSAMQTGVVDCALYPVRLAGTVSLQEVGKHVTYTGFPFPSVPYVIMVSQAKWRALAPDMQKVLQDSTAELDRSSFAYFADDAKEVAEIREKLRAGGVTYHPDLGAADQDEIRKAALQTWEAIAKETGPAALANRQKILQALGR